MKRFFVCLIVMCLIFPAVACASDSNLGFTTDTFLSELSLCLDSFSDVLPAHYPLEYTEKDAAEKSIIKLLGKHTCLYITQDGDMVKSFKVVSDEENNGDYYERACEIDACFMSALLVSNDYFTDENVMVSLSSIMYDREIITQNGISYRYVTGEPFTTVVALEVVPAK